MMPNTVLVPRFVTSAGGAIWWSNMRWMQVAPSGEMKRPRVPVWVRGEGVKKLFGQYPNVFCANLKVASLTQSVSDKGTAKNMVVKTSSSAVLCQQSTLPETDIARKISHPHNLWHLSINLKYSASIWQDHHDMIFFGAVFCISIIGEWFIEWSSSGSPHPQESQNETWESNHLPFNFIKS